MDWRLRGSLGGGDFLGSKPDAEWVLSDENRSKGDPTDVSFTPNKKKGKTNENRRTRVATRIRWSVLNGRRDLKCRLIRCFQVSCCVITKAKEFRLEWTSDGVPSPAGQELGNPSILPPPQHYNRMYNVQRLFQFVAHIPSVYYTPSNRRIDFLGRLQASGSSSSALCVHLLKHCWMSRWNMLTCVCSSAFSEQGGWFTTAGAASSSSPCCCSPNCFQRVLARYS